MFLMRPTTLPAMFRHLQPKPNLKKQLHMLYKNYILTYGLPSQIHHDRERKFHQQNYISFVAQCDRKPLHIILV